MQIQKINNNKLKIILNSSDLLKNNIDIDSFLSNSEESQNFFFNLLSLIETEYSFDIEDNKAIVETISLDNNIFILTITKLINNPREINTFPPVFIFNSYNDIFELYYSCLRENINFNNIYIYSFMDSYFVFNYEKNEKIQNLLLEYSSCQTKNDMLDILIEHGKRVNLV